MSKKDVKGTESKIKTTAEKKPYQAPLYDMEKVKCLSCKECKKFSISMLPGCFTKCTCLDRNDGKEGFSFTEYHECLQPTDEEMQDAVSEIREMQDAGKLSKYPSLGAKVILGRLSGSMSHEDAVALCKAEYPQGGPSFVIRALLFRLHDSKSTKALAQWARTDIDARKKLRTRKAINTLLSVKAGALEITDDLDRIILDGKRYVVLEKDTVKAKVLAESGDCTRMFDQEFNNFRTSDLNRWMNTTWLEENPEASKCMIGHAELLTEKEYRKFITRLPKLKAPWWLADGYPDSEMVYVVKPDGDVTVSASYYEGNYVRPVFWIDIMHLKFKNNKTMPLDVQLEAIGKRYGEAMKNNSIGEDETNRLLDDIRQDILKVRAISGLDDELFCLLLEDYGIKKDMLLTGDAVTVS